jgi:TonB-linked SusC/RagA family outer membrane protein
MLTFFTIAMVHAINLEAQEILDRKVTINVVEVEVQDVLGLLGKQAKVKFTYNPQQIPIHNRVTLSVTEGKLSYVLHKVLDEIDYKVVGRQIALKPLQNHASVTPDKTEVTTSSDGVAALTVSGTITDANGGTALPGVNVVVKGSTLGTTADGEGHYSIEVPQGDAVLVFSFIGYATQEVLVNNQTTIDVKMVEDIQSLGEVVVVGYGTQEKKEITGAVSQINGDDVKKSQVVSMGNALAGRIAGVIVNQPNGEPGNDDAKILIRGRGTIGDASPLYVIDGVANRDTQGIARLDPNDIESISVLKDGSAAIYGAQGANGVILVTTKRGKTGKPKISYSFNEGFVNPTRLPKMMNGVEFAKGVNQITPGTYSDQAIADIQSGKTPTTDWVKAVTKNHALQKRHSLSLSGGNDIVKYFLSGGTVFQNGIVKNDHTTQFRQYNFRSNIDVQITKKLGIGLDLTGRQENKNFLDVDQQTVWSSTIQASPLIPATLPDGLPTGGLKENNPLAIVTSPGYDRNSAAVINGTLKANYKLPIDGLSVDGFAAYDFRDDFRKKWVVPHVYYTLDTNGDPQPTTATNNISTNLSEYFTRFSSITLHGKIRYDKIIGDHKISAFYAYEQNKMKTDLFSAARGIYGSTAVDQLFAGDPSNQTNDGTVPVNSYLARQNYFGRVAYSLKEKYMVQFNFRYDGSSKFASGKRFGFFPGVSAGWRISEESFLQGNPVVSNLKLKGSWGRVGNDKTLKQDGTNYNDFAYLSLYNLTTPGSGIVIGGQDANGLYPGIAANGQFTWESKDVIDLGFESGFFNNKLTLDFDYFSEKRDGFLTDPHLSIPVYTGLSAGNLPPLNIGKTSNKGFDATANYRTKIGEVNFSMGGNITYARNKVINIAESKSIPSWQKIEGKPIGDLSSQTNDLTYQVIGIYKTQADIDAHPNSSISSTPVIGQLMYKDIDGDGVITSNDRYRSTTTATPRLQYGVNLDAQYKGFDFSLLFQGQAQSSQFLTYNFSAVTNGIEYYYKNAFSTENPNGTLPSITKNMERNSLWVRNTSYLRLKSIELGYTIPRALLSKVGLQTVRVYVNGFNLLTFDHLKKDGLADPENINIQSWRYPQTKSINFGLNLTL